MRVTVNQGFGTSLGNMIDVLSGEKPQDDAWVELTETEPGHFAITDDSMTVKDGDPIIDQAALGFCSWDDTVADEDNGSSDAAQCFRMSERLRWNDVILTPDGIVAPSAERAAEALQHVELCAWCPGDI